MTAPASAQRAYDRLCEHARETALFVSIEALLNWDERTYMPPAAGPYRAEQVALLAGVIHERHTAPQVGQWLAELAASPLAADPASDTGATIRQLQRQYDRKSKLPKALVQELTRAAVLGQQAWVAARQRDDFASFRPHLQKMIELKRQEADALGHSGNRYDALLEDYEPGETTANLKRVLGALRDDLVPLVRQIADSGRHPAVDILSRRYDVARQAELSRTVAEAVGFSFAAGRLDTTAHPFCTEMGPRDCRITTRYEEHFFNGAFFGTLHEVGHGLYEQGLPPDHYGLPLGKPASLGIHESQSRMWENFVGRSRPFWEYLYPAVVQAFGESLRDVPLETFYQAINDVRPSLIRVEADEATYNLHIMIRFELEQALLSGELNAAEAPAAWHEKYRSYLGLAAPSDADGVLQDIHWSAGLVGYFPTYTLGNLYAAQFFEQADRDLGGLAEQFKKGQFGPLLQWLRTNIHSQGQRYDAADLVRRVTGKPLSHQPLMRHLRSKLGPIYGLA
jgi:carboxypeptidase Taq